MIKTSLPILLLCFFLFGCNGNKREFYCLSGHDIVKYQFSDDQHKDSIFALNLVRLYEKFDEGKFAKLSNDLVFRIMISPTRRPSVRYEFFNLLNEQKIRINITKIRSDQLIEGAGEVISDTIYVVDSNLWKEVERKLSKIDFNKKNEDKCDLADGTYVFVENFNEKGKHIRLWTSPELCDYSDQKQILDLEQILNINFPMSSH